MTRYLYYPGCSLGTNARAYHLSLMAVAERLKLELVEIEDWNCCGATEYVSLSLVPAYALISRNLALAARQADGCPVVVAPCSACYLNLAKADHYMQESPGLREKVGLALAAGGLDYAPGTLTIRHLLDVLVNDQGVEAIRRNVVRPLTGLRVAPYLGCMVPRPDLDRRWSSPELPVELDRVLRALGAEVVDFPLKTHCCGGHMPHITPHVAYELLRRLIHTATEAQADMMVTLCPMCQLNVDAYQGEMNRHFGTAYRMPILFFTQLMGLAFGKEPGELGIGTELVDARPALARIGAEPQAPEAAGRRPRRKAKEGLPLPRMPAGEEIEEATP